MILYKKNWVEKICMGGTHKIKMYFPLKELHPALKKEYVDKGSNVTCEWKNDQTSDFAYVFFGEEETNSTILVEYFVQACCGTLLGRPTQMRVTPPKFTSEGSKKNKSPRKETLERVEKWRRQHRHSRPSAPPPLQLASRPAPLTSLAISNLWHPLCRWRPLSRYVESL